MLISCSHDNGPEIKSEISNPPSNDLKELSIPISNTVGLLKHENKSFDGYNLFTIYKDTYLIDLCGRVVNHWASDYVRGGAFSLLEDGSLLRSGKIENQNLPYGGLGGIIEKFDWNGNLTWQFTYSEILPNYQKENCMMNNSSK